MTEETVYSKADVENCLKEYTQDLKKRLSYGNPDFKKVINNVLYEYLQELK